MLVERVYLSEKDKLLLSRQKKVTLSEVETLTNIVHVLFLGGCFKLYR